MKEYTVNCNIVVVADGEKDAIEKVIEGEFDDMTIVDVLNGEWGG